MTDQTIKYIFFNPESSGLIKYYPPHKIDLIIQTNEVPALELREMWCTRSLPLFPSPLWPGVVAPDRVLSMGQIELFW